MRDKKSILKFITIFIISFIILEIVERVFGYFFHIDLHNLKWGWIGFIIIYGFKFHIFCCVLPMMWASYKCKHKKCKHTHCEH